MAQPLAPVRPPAISPASASPPPLKPAEPSLGTVPVNRGPEAGPRKETARIALTADSPTKATVKLPDQPASVPPAGVIHAPAPPSAVARPRASGLLESVPMRLCWALLGVSALILLIQLWTYFS
ncbi:MAG: hypothetical protein ACREIF_04840 [Chthoniobacterales bacterium]